MLVQNNSISGFTIANTVSLTKSVCDISFNNVLMTDADVSPLSSKCQMNGIGPFSSVIPSRVSTTTFQPITISTTQKLSSELLPKSKELSSMEFPASVTILQNDSITSQLISNGFNTVALDSISPIYTFLLPQHSSQVQSTILQIPQTTADSLQFRLQSPQVTFSSNPGNFPF